MWPFDYLSTLFSTDSPAPSTRPTTTKLTYTPAVNPALQQLLHPDPNAPRTTRLTRMLTVEGTTFDKDVLKKIYRLMEIKVKQGLVVTQNYPTVEEVEAIMTDVCTKQGVFDETRFEAMKQRLKQPLEAVFQRLTYYVGTVGTPMTTQRPAVDPKTGKTKVIDHCKNVTISTTLDVGAFAVKKIGIQAARTMRHHYNKDILEKIERDCEARKLELAAEQQQQEEDDYMPSTPGIN